MEGRKEWERGRENCCVVHFLKPTLRRAVRYGWTELYYRYISLRQEASKTKSEVLGERSRERT